ncbi:hypothetical protein D9758_016114 [Tetrapyrgos nigripes]|uniref:Uncharacterized protein n=1 Tax=Tetrapyrgos nigripes TaxID=182062 RepID=A0A8H5C1B8_9AGAR|nr:hypothetical protein D9758_016114 [Tetrapyrgos nigripes]
MRAFTVLSMLACATISFAIPAPNVADGAVGTVKDVASAGLNQVKDFDNALHGWFQGVEVDGVLPVRRGLDVANVKASVHEDCDCTTIPNIIKDLIEQLKPLLDQLSSLTTETCTVDLVKNILGEVVTILHGAVGAVNALVNKEVSIVLATVNGVLSIVDLCGLIGTLLQLVFGAVGVVIKVVAAADKDVIMPLLCEVVSLVGQLLQIVCSILASTGILSLLLSILTPFLQLITSLGVTDAFAGLGLPL